MFSDILKDYYTEKQFNKLPINYWAMINHHLYQDIKDTILYCKDGSILYKKELVDLFIIK